MFPICSWWKTLLISIITTSLGCIIVTVYLLQVDSPSVIMPSPSSFSLDDLQGAISTTLDSAMETTVSVSLLTDLKSYIHDPSKTVSPSAVSGQLKGVEASGILIHKQWYVLTSKHAVSDSKAQYQVSLQDGRRFSVQHIWLDPFLDLAVLQIVDHTWNVPTDLPIATFLPLDHIADLGQFVFSIGRVGIDSFPRLGFGILVTRQKQLLLHEKNLYTKRYQTDAYATVGNSWWPLVDLAGHVIGMVSFVDTDQQYTYALPLSASFVSTLIQAIEKYQYIARPLLGIEYLDIGSDIQHTYKLSTDYWSLVTAVIEGSSADQAGIVVWDILLAIDGKEIRLDTPLLRYLYTYLPDVSVQMTIWRKGETIEIPMVLGQKEV